MQLKAFSQEVRGRHDQGASHHHRDHVAQAHPANLTTRARVTNGPKSTSRLASAVNPTSEKASPSSSDTAGRFAPVFIFIFVAAAFRRLA
ncbi:hypothetical protein EYC84_011779 [Monilinia fructicola]|uniref:Uncharacterized protein n=1 Tax=Monilinia fructicola TaxID=38448 RepID=A0A5M9J4I2_MONFR|nr:hypothetical protein EYC84_011779 [Monilinia fructicola]